VKRSSIFLVSIIAGYVLAILLSVALKAVGIDIPATLAKSASEYNMYGGVEGLLMTIGLSWAIYQVLARRFLEKETPKPTLIESSPVADSVELHSVPSANAQPTSVRRKRQWTRPPPLVWAVGAALAWAILSVGPARLARDLGELVPRDTVTVPRAGGAVVLGTEVLRSWDPYCPWAGGSVESDGMCHERSGGDVTFLVGDIVRGGQNALLAFLAVGAALLLWPRLRAAILQPPVRQAALPGPDTLTSELPTDPRVVSSATAGDKLRQLATLRDDGIISSEEFEAKKAELLRSF
jgi:hypothetical protein